MSIHFPPQPPETTASGVVSRHLHRIAPIASAAIPVLLILTVALIVGFAVGTATHVLLPDVLFLAPFTGLISTGFVGLLLYTMAMSPTAHLSAPQRIVGLLTLASIAGFTGQAITTAAFGDHVRSVEVVAADSVDYFGTRSSNYRQLRIGEVRARYGRLADDLAAAQSRVTTLTDQIACQSVGSRQSPAECDKFISSANNSITEDLAGRLLVQLDSATQELERARTRYTEYAITPLPTNNPQSANCGSLFDDGVTKFAADLCVARNSPKTMSTPPSDTVLAGKVVNGVLSATLPARFNAYIPVSPAMAPGSLFVFSASTTALMFLLLLMAVLNPMTPRGAMPSTRDTSPSLPREQDD